MFENLLAHPEVGLIFVIPGNGDTLRVSGNARIVLDRSLQERLAINGKAPNLVLVVTVEEAFMHCPKCIVRSRLWMPEHWPDRSSVPSLAEAIVAHAKPLEDVTQVQAIIDEGNTRLYRRISGLREASTAGRLCSRISHVNDRTVDAGRRGSRMSRRALASTARALVVIRDCLRVCADGYAAARTYEAMRHLADAELSRRGLSRATLGAEIVRRKELSVAKTVDQSSKWRKPCTVTLSSYRRSRISAKPLLYC